MKIGILFGGNSLEHEISIVTAYQLRNKLKDYYEIVMLYLDFDNNLYDSSKLTIHAFKSSKITGLKKTMFVQGGIKKTKLDCIINATHGENGEDGVAAGICRFYNIPYVGTSIVSGSLCMNKWLTYKYLSSNGIPMIDTTLYTYDDYLNGREINEFPVIIKPNLGGSSLGIVVCECKEDFDSALIKVFMEYKEVIIQRYYPNIKEYNLAIYDDGYSNLEQINKKSDIFSFDNKYNESFKQFHQGIVNERIEDFKRIARDVYKLTDSSGIIRLDFFMIDNDIIVNEVNTTPGALSMYLFDDFISIISYLINQAIVNSYKKYTKGSFLSNTEINK